VHFINFLAGSNNDIYLLGNALAYLQYLFFSESVSAEIICHILEFTAIIWCNAKFNIWVVLEKVIGFCPDACIWYINQNFLYIRIEYHALPIF